jgi:peptide/nickel transport system substrate-binding protein
MIKKVGWVVVSCLIIFSLILSACSEEPKDEGTISDSGDAKVVTTVKDVSEDTQTSVTEDDQPQLRDPEEPKYGGTAVLQRGNVSFFDPLNHVHTMCPSVYFTNEELISGDWTKGPAGTQETDLIFGFGGRMELMTGWLCESWDLPDEETIVFHLRKGVHWWDKPPVNGREFVADDVVWTINTAFNNPGCWFNLNLTRVGDAPTSATALDKYTVEIKAPPRIQGLMVLEIGDRLYQFPEGISEQVDLEDWRNAIGTGAWMLTDYVSQVSQTYTKNPDYWQFDPLHPENRLPYPDTLRALNIPDTSTQQSALRTGQIDQLVLNYESGKILIDQLPDLEYIKQPGQGMFLLSGRVDKEDLPFKDIKVRRALNLAINQEEITEAYYEGGAELFAWPVAPVKEFMPYYIPLEEQPESVQELFEYNPEKAKQLLAEAGYPDGFKTKVQCLSGDADYMAVLRDYLLKVNVDMEIEPMETGVFNSLAFGKNHDEMIYWWSMTFTPYFLWDGRGGSLWNITYFSDEYTTKAWNDMKQAIGKDDDAVIQIMKEYGTYMLDNAFAVFLPQPYRYAMYWPWFQNYRGEWDIGCTDQERNWTFIWVDADMKKEMGY